MPSARWMGAVIARAKDDEVQIVENNVYFPRSAVQQRYLRPSDTTSVCPWKGTASYYHIEVDGMTNRDAAWTYPHPSDAARLIQDHIAFWKGVLVER